ncbi:hypothetical protein NQZ68_039154 [Dissostichus eleginoides]|nr:hypothetical protein NQZ68_039154 [Dissostichus eleginoides]
MVYKIRWRGAGRETNIFYLLLPTVGVTPDQIQSNGSFRSKQNMMYSLPGDREVFLCRMMSKQQQSRLHHTQRLKRGDN